MKKKQCAICLGTEGYIVEFHKIPYHELCYSKASGIKRRTIRATVIRQATKVNWLGMTRERRIELRKLMRGEDTLE